MGELSWAVLLMSSLVPGAAVKLSMSTGCSMFPGAVKLTHVTDTGGSDLSEHSSFISRSLVNGGNDA